MNMGSYYYLHECEMRTRTVNNENIFLVEIPPAYLYFPCSDVYFVILAWHICSLLDMFKKNSKKTKSQNFPSFILCKLILLLCSGILGYLGYIFLLLLFQFLPVPQKFNMLK